MAARNILFHSGALYVINTGIALPTPRRLATVQETSFDFKGDVKELMGENKFAVDVATGSIKITGKAKGGQVDPAFMNEMFFGQTMTTGSRILVQNELVTVASAAATAAAGANYDTDMGVTNTVTGEVYTRVASAPAAKQYTINVATGVFAFNATENGNVLSIDYIKRDAANGSTLTLNNTLAGASVIFKGVFTKKYTTGHVLTMELQQCIADSMQFATKINDYAMPEFNFSAFADSANKVMTMSVNA